MGFIGNIGIGPRVTPKQQQTLDRLKGEIEIGVKNGTLTSAEAQKLYTEYFQLKAQMEAPKARGGFLSGMINRMNEERTNAAAEQLEKNIKSERTNDSVDFGKLMNSNIGVTAQRIQQLGANIAFGAELGNLSPKEQAFLGAKFEELKQTFLKAVGNDGKLDAGEMRQLKAMMRSLARDTFSAARGNLFPEVPFQPTSPQPGPGQAQTMAIRFDPTTGQTSNF